MGDVLARTGTNFVLIPPDVDSNVALNGSTPGQLGIPTTGFVAALWEDGASSPATLATLVAPPYNLSIDNVSSASQGMYRVNITLPNRSKYEFVIRHTTDMIALRQESWDLETRPEMLSTIRGNTKIDFSIAATPVGAPRNVAVGVLDYMRIRKRYDGAADFTTPNLVSDETIEFTYAVSGQTNPISVEPQ